MATLGIRWLLTCTKLGTNRRLIGIQTALKGLDQAQATDSTLAIATCLNPHSGFAHDLLANSPYR